MPDIADQLDAAIGAAPSDAPALEPTLVLGRRALRRRRVAYGVGAAATALVIGGTAWAVSPGGTGASRSDGPGFDGQPSDSAAPPTERADRSDSGLTWIGEDAARLDGPGQILVKPGWSVSEDVAATGSWHAVEVEKGDRRQWFLFSTDGSMTISNLHAPAPGYDSFQDWVDVNAPFLDDHGGADRSEEVDAWPGVPRDDLVRWAPEQVSLTSGLLPAGDDVTIVAERHPIDLGASFAPPFDTSVAKVTEGSATWYVVARRPDQYIAVSADEARTKYDVADLDEFVDFARDRYAEGGGGLL